MQLLTLSCGNCGAPLDAPSTTTFLTCNYCGSRLAIKRTAASTYTEILHLLEGHTAAIADNTSLLRLKTEVELLEKDYTEKKARLESTSIGEGRWTCGMWTVVSLLLTLLTLVSGVWPVAVATCLLAAISGLAWWGNSRAHQRWLNMELVVHQAERALKERQQELRRRVGIAP